jgi:hyperosmotically inducible periplasmic protein
MMTNRASFAVTMAATLAIALLGLPRVSRAAAQMPEQSGAQAMQNTSSRDAEARLNKKQFQNVKVSVNDGIATLTGTVDLYEYKADAAKRVLRASGVNAVRNQIEVAGSNVSDKELQSNLQEKLAYDRVGYGNVFDAIGVKVENGVVTLTGHSHDYPNKDSALALAATMPGVKDVVDDIEVDPLSPMDDRTRLAVARSVYGYPTLNKYAIDPAKPIRISVQNGNVALYGTVDSQADKDTANLRASTVPNVFSVKNYLHVAGQPSERQQMNQPSERQPNQNQPGGKPMDQPENR